MSTLPSQAFHIQAPNQQLLRHVFETFALLLAICVFTRPQGRLGHAAEFLSAAVSAARLSEAGAPPGEAPWWGLIGVCAAGSEGKGSADEERERADIHSCLVLKPPHSVPLLSGASFCVVFLPLLPFWSALFQFHKLERVARGWAVLQSVRGRCGL